MLQIIQCYLYIIYEYTIFALSPFMIHKLINIFQQYIGKPNYFRFIKSKKTILERKQAIKLLTEHLQNAVSLLSHDIIKYVFRNCFILQWPYMSP